MEIDKSDCLETYYSRVLLIVRSSIHMHTSVVGIQILRSYIINNILKVNNTTLRVYSPIDHIPKPNIK